MNVSQHRFKIETLLAKNTDLEKINKCPYQNNVNLSFTQGKAVMQRLDSS